MLKKIILLSSAVLAAIALTIYRVHMIGNNIDSFNGFLKPENSMQGLIFTVVTCAVLLAFVVLVFIDKSFPGSPRRTSRLLASLNILYSAALIVDCFVSLNTAKEGIDVFKICLELCFIGFILYYANCMYTQKKPLIYASVIPLAFFVLVLAIVFIDSFGIIKSSEVALKIVSLIFCVLFFLFYARYVSKFNFNKIRKVTYALGICAGIMCAITAFGDIFAHAFYEGVVSRISLSEKLLLSSTSIYVFGFLIISSANKRLYSTYHRKETVEYVSESIEEIEIKTDYVEDI